MEEKYKQALEQDIARYGRLKQLKNSSEFRDYMEFLSNAAAIQMIQPFVGKKAPTYEEFMAVWGEIRAKLHTLQEIGGADLIEQQLIKQLQEYNNPST